MNGKFFFNRYYTDAGTEYAAQRLTEVLAGEGITLTAEKTPVTVFGGGQAPGCGFAVFWDKDTVAAKTMQQQGIRVFNDPDAIALCDDKAKTFAALSGSRIKLTETVVSPLTYDVSDGADDAFFALAEAHCGYPMVFKQNVGSQGRQVERVDSRDRLEELRRQYRHTPHAVQKFYDCGDLRIYAVGGAVIAALRRTPAGGGYKANRAAGGNAVLFEPDERLCTYAKIIAKTLKLDYFAADFLDCGEPRLLEVNSNAYFQYAESLGADIAGPYGRHIAAAFRGEIC